MHVYCSGCGKEETCHLVIELTRGMKEKKREEEEEEDKQICLFGIQTINQTMTVMLGNPMHKCDHLMLLQLA
jgi:hypothetical protein